MIQFASAIRPRGDMFRPIPLCSITEAQHLPLLWPTADQEGTGSPNSHQLVNDDCRDAMGHDR